MKVQKRGKRIAMSPAEIDDFLTTERTARVATISPSGPHVTPLWFVWDGESIWLSSLSGSQRWADLDRDPRVALVVDAGEAYTELRGVEIHGNAEIVGEVPRVGEPVPELTRPEELFAAKYVEGDGPFPHDGRHAWRRIVPTKIASWDFRKLP
jgi:hypothetical protein